MISEQYKPSLICIISILVNAIPETEGTPRRINWLTTVEKYDGKPTIQATRVKR